jgi:hypothetical protein
MSIPPAGPIDPTSPPHRGPGRAARVLRALFRKAKGRIKSKESQAEPKPKPKPKPKPNSDPGGEEIPEGPSTPLRYAQDERLRLPVHT